MTFLLFSLYDQLNIGVNDMKCIRFCSYVYSYLYLTILESGTPIMSGKR